MVNHCGKDEETNQLGPYRCLSSNHCQGDRTCNENNGWCTGKSGCKNAEDKGVDLTVCPKNALKCYYFGSNKTIYSEYGNYIADEMEKELSIKWKM